MATDNLEVLNDKNEPKVNELVNRRIVDIYTCVVSISCGFHDFVLNSRSSVRFWTFLPYDLLNEIVYGLNRNPYLITHSRRSNPNA